MPIRAEASAPSNIALIKYMGKTGGTGNHPANRSLSYTLEHLRTFVVVEELAGGSDTWAPLEGFAPIQLSDTGLNKYLAHFGRLKREWGIAGQHKVFSANNFPSDCGLASSASSFAALTLATYELARRVRPELSLSQGTLSELSRAGSGSSCRSLFSPWAAWEGSSAGAVDLPLVLEHAVIVVAAGKKSVTSSEAHARVQSSRLWEGRSARAEARFEELLAALKASDWRSAYEICWTEFWDMHALFETSRPPFGYMTAETLQVLEKLRGIWAAENDGPLVTMDAGANVHLLLRPDQTKRAAGWIDGYRAIRSWE